MTPKIRDLNSDSESCIYNIKCLQFLGVFSYHIRSLEKGKVEVKKSIFLVCLQTLYHILFLMVGFSLIGICIITVARYKEYTNSQVSTTTIYIIVIYLVVEHIAFLFLYIILCAKENLLISLIKYSEKIFSNFNLNRPKTGKQSFKEKYIAFFCIIIEILMATTFVNNLYGLKYVHSMTDLLFQRSMYWSTILLHKKSIISVEILIENIWQILKNKARQKIQMSDLNDIFKLMKTYQKLEFKIGKYFNTIIIIFLANSIITIIMHIFISISLLPYRCVSAFVGIFFSVTKLFSVIMVLNSSSIMTKTVRFYSLLT